jgi:membrane associated rhomboid family serine protease
VSIAGLLDGDVLDALQRQPGETGDGELWRIVTSLLVHDGWLALAANLLLLVVVGVAFERRRSRAEWLALYLAAGVAGQLVAWLWQPEGAGNSVACLGLAGGLAVIALRRSGVPSWALGYPAVVLAMFIAFSLGGAAAVVTGAAAVVAAGAAFQWRQRRPDAPLAPQLAWTLLAGAGALILLRDIHGPALLTGAALGTVFEYASGAVHDLPV